MKRVANPPNPYAHIHAEYLGEPPPVRLEVYEEDARSILSCNDSPDIPFRWSLNPYRGCQHACSYCYARPTHEYLGFGAGTDFESKICVKRNAPELLDRELSSSRRRRDEIAFSGVTDCYQPLEVVYQLTRRCLEVCARHATPVAIVTKSYLILRDLDVLERLHAVAGVQVMCSIAFCDDRLARAVEPGAPPPSRRFEAMRRLHEAGIPVSLMMAPIICGLNDREIPAVLERAAECGARGASYTPLRLPGNVAAVFLERLRTTLPDHAQRVETRIREMRGGRLNDPRFGHRMGGHGEYWRGVEQLFTRTARRLGLAPASLESRACPQAAPRNRTAATQLPLFRA